MIALSDCFFKSINYQKAIKSVFLFKDRTNFLQYIRFNGNRKQIPHWVPAKFTALIYCKKELHHDTNGHNNISCKQGSHWTTLMTQMEQDIGTSNEKAYNLNRNNRATLAQCSHQTEDHGQP
jgi:hypothetical protein